MQKNKNFLNKMFYISAIWKELRHLTRFVLQWYAKTAMILVLTLCVKNILDIFSNNNDQFMPKNCHSLEVYISLVSSCPKIKKMVGNLIIFGNLKATKVPVSSLFSSNFGNLRLRYNISLDCSNKMDSFCVSSDNKHQQVGNILSQHWRNSRRLRQPIWVDDSLLMKMLWKNSLGQIRVCLFYDDDWT